jgi:hypothetical protein
MKALIKENLVVDVCEKEFEVHPSLVWVDAAEGCEFGWTYENGRFTAPIQPQLSYSDHRKMEYPTIGDQLDALFHAGVFPPEMAALIQAVKDKYPKEQS